MHCFLFLALMQHAAVGGADARELFDDSRFERGFTLTAASHSAPKEEIGVLQTAAQPGTQAPAWRIAQWASRYLLQPGRCESIGTDAWRAVTQGKRVEVERQADGLTRLLLEVNGEAEYDGHLRQTGEPWPHLLIEQGFGNGPVRVGEVKGLPFTLEMRVPSCKLLPWAEGKLDPGLHTAQVSAYWTVHNLTPGTPDYRDMIWFGIPLFDARYEVPPAYCGIDGGKEDASGKFICVLDGKRFWTGNTGDGAWRKIDVDLLPLLREALSIAQENGHLKQTRLEDLAITSFNLGWEVPGPYNAALELRGLSFKAKTE
jgi:hypothetical protein